MDLGPPGPPPTASELGVELRVGVQTGECDVIGDAVAGLAVHTGGPGRRPGSPKRRVSLEGLGGSFVSSFRNFPG